jgi:hypothetical protein
MRAPTHAGQQPDDLRRALRSFRTALEGSPEDPTRCRALAGALAEAMRRSEDNDTKLALLLELVEVQERETHLRPGDEMAWSHLFRALDQLVRVLERWGDSRLAAWQERRTAAVEHHRYRVPTDR